MVGMELVVGYLFAWAVGKARRAGRRADEQVDAAVDAAVDEAGAKLRALVQRKLGRNSAMDRLEFEAWNGRPEPARRTAQRLERALARAARKDPEFKAELDELSTALAAHSSAVLKMTRNANTRVSDAVIAHGPGTSASADLVDSPGSIVERSVHAVSAVTSYSGSPAAQAGSPSVAGKPSSTLAEPVILEKQSFTQPTSWTPPSAPSTPASSAHEVSRYAKQAKARIIAAADAGNGGRLQLVAASGYGKSRLLKELAPELRTMGYLTLFTSASDEQSRGGGELDKLLAVRSRCVAIIDGLAGDLHKQDDVPPDLRPVLDDIFDRLTQATKAQASYDLPGATANLTVTGSPGASIQGGNATVNVYVHEVNKVKLDLVAIQDDFVETLSDLANRIPLAVIVDDLHWLIETGSEQWLAQAFQRLNGVLILTAAWSGHDTAPWGEAVKLGAFDESETMDYARQALSPRWSLPAASEVGRQLAATISRPGDVVSACTAVKELIEPCEDPGEIRERIREVFSRDGAIDVHQGVHQSIDRAASRYAGTPVEVFDQIAALRRFTPEVLTGVLTLTEPEQPAEAPRPIKALAESPRLKDFYDWLSQADGYVTVFDDGSVRERRDDDEAESEDDAEPPAEQQWWNDLSVVSTEQRLHDVIRSDAIHRLGQERPSRLSAVHEAAEKYYRNKINLDGEVDTKSLYAGYARYEDPQWQQELREWIFHAANVSPERFEDARNGMIRLFFEIFWWWDAEVSTYCRTLIADFRTILPRTRQGTWVGLLDAFRDGYVAGEANQRQGQDIERWKQAADALTQLWVLLDLTKGSPPQEEKRDLRSIYILTAALWSDVAWGASAGREKDRRRAAQWAAAARDACTDERDHWKASWATYLEAKLWAPVDPERASGLLADLPARILEDEDNELLATITQLHADIAWWSGRRRLAFDYYTRAALHFVVYHVHQELNKQVPNPYTVSCYESVRSAFTERLAEAERDGDEILARTARIRAREYFAPYWGRVAAEPEDPTNLPPQPKPEDLGTISSQYAKDLLWLRDEMEEELGADILEPLTDLPTPWPPEETAEAA